MTETERDRFEAFLRDSHLYSPEELLWDSERGCHSTYSVHIAWKSWQQARAEALARVTGAPVAWRIKHKDGHYIYGDGPSPLLADGDEWKCESLYLEGIQNPQRDQDMFVAGWRTAANWMERDDLKHDVGSPAYLKDMAAAITAIDAKEPA